MTVQLAPIRPHDLQAGDVLQHRDGVRVTLTMRGLDHWPPGWRYYRNGDGCFTSYILDVDIERTGPHRLWWLDNAVDRP